MECVGDAGGEGGGGVVGMHSACEVRVTAHGARLMLRLVAGFVVGPDPHIAASVVTRVDLLKPRRAVGLAARGDGVRLTGSSLGCARIKKGVGVFCSSQQSVGGGYSTVQDFLSRGATLLNFSRVAPRDPDSRRPTRGGGYYRRVLPPT